MSYIDAMPAILHSLFAFIAAIALLVAIHEFGHYAVARLFGVKVLRYSIGFGQVLWSRRAGVDQTEYCLSAIPLGGYVKLLDERDCAVSFAERERAFNRQSGSVRMAILFAGPAFNLLFAVLAYALMFMNGVPGIKPVIGAVEPGSVAARAGLREGNTIVSVGQQRVLTWESATLGILDELLTNGSISLELSEKSPAGRPEIRQAVLQTAGLESELTEPGQLFVKLGFKPWTPVPDAVIGELVAGGPAERAGMRSGDRVLAVDGIAVDSWVQWVELIRARPGQRIDVRLERAGKEQELAVDVETVDGDTGSIGRIGAAVLLSPGEFDDMRAEERYTPINALQRAVIRTWDMSALTLRMIWRMLVGDVSVKNISGPINIAQYAGYSASIGLSAFLGFLAVVSISLGVLNLLPVPMLDGGQIVYTLAEQLKGSPLSERAQMIGQQVGLGLLLLLMTFAFYNDISRLLG